MTTRMAPPSSTCTCRLASRSLARSAGSMLLLSMIFSGSSYAQLTPSNAIPLTTALRSSNTRMDSTFSTMTTSPTQSEIVQTPRPTPTYNPNPNGSEGDDGPTAEEIANQQHQSILNYYFVFLALLAVIVAVAVYVLAKRRKRRKLENRNGGTSALARDLSGWTNSRRWINGTRATRGGNSGRDRRDEGLNEDGEAPPPYMPKAEPATGQSGDNNTADRLSIPLRTLSRDGRSAMKPPDYEASLNTRNESPGDVTRPSAATRGGESSREILGG